MPNENDSPLAKRKSLRQADREAGLRKLKSQGVESGDPHQAARARRKGEPRGVQRTAVEGLRQHAANVKSPSRGFGLREADSISMARGRQLGPEGQGKVQKAMRAEKRKRRGK